MPQIVDEVSPLHPGPEAGTSRPRPCGCRHDPPGEFVRAVLGLDADTDGMPFPGEPEFHAMRPVLGDVVVIAPRHLVGLACRLVDVWDEDLPDEVEVRAEWRPDRSVLQCGAFRDGLGVCVEFHVSLVSELGDQGFVGHAVDVLKNAMRSRAGEVPAGMRP